MVQAEVDGMMQIMTPEEQLQLLLRNSYRNFHADGVDYICLNRTDNLTVKVYFFDKVTDSPEIVSPHDHRYDFVTKVLNGRCANSLWYETKDEKRGERYQEFNFHTPLNGGKGFEWRREVFLTKSSSTLYFKGSRYLMPFNEIHTLERLNPGTILLLWQYRDIHEKTTPSHTYVKNKAPVAPLLDGLYERFTESDMILKLKYLEKMSPGILKEHCLHHVVNPELV